MNTCNLTDETVYINPKTALVNILVAEVEVKRVGEKCSQKNDKAQSTDIGLLA